MQPGRLGRWRGLGWDYSDQDRMGSLMGTRMVGGLQAASPECRLNHR